MAWAQTDRVASIYSSDDIWNRQEHIGGSIAASTVLHAFLFGGILVYSYVFGAGSGDRWGGNTQGDGAISATLVSRAALPLPQQHQPNPENILANQSQGLSQSVRKEAPKPQEPEAIPIQQKETKPKRLPPQPLAREPERTPPVEVAKNNVVPFGQSGPVNMPMTMVKTALGTGGLTIGGGDFGSRYAWYVDAVRRKISENWLKYEIDPNISAADRVYVVFDIMRDGSPERVAIEKSSGLASLDQSAVRALQRIDTFGPLPPDYRGNRVSVEFYFDYKK